MKDSESVSTRSSLIFGLVTAALASFGTLSAFLLTLTVGAYVGCVGMGLVCCALGALRAVWPGKPWFSGRSRPTDAIVYITVGILLLSFAPLTNVGIN